jgi:hypothetical protein
VELGSPEEAVRAVQSKNGARLGQRQVFVTLSDSPLEKGETAPEKRPFFDYELWYSTSIPFSIVSVVCKAWSNQFFPQLNHSDLACLAVTPSSLATFPKQYEIQTFVLYLASVER